MPGHSPYFRHAMLRSAPVVVIAPDSFKGSLDAPGVCAAIAAGLRKVWPEADLRARPMADGGEGTLDAVLAASGTGALRFSHRVAGAGGHPTQAAWGRIDHAGMPTAVIEVAQVVGLTDADGTSVPVVSRSTRGVGELMRALLDAGVRRFMIGLGGSSTNDGGSGLLAALGMRFLDRAGTAVEPTPIGLGELAAVDASGLDPRLRDTGITIMSDVSNPLCGARGATAVFGPQKGVEPEAVQAIDATLSRYASLVERAAGRPVAGNPGAGAAGGLGFALQLIGATPASGAEVVADLIGLDAALRDADWAIAGEGRSDAQTLSGKAPYVVAARAARAGVPVSLLSGALDAASLEALGGSFAGCFAVPGGPMTLEAAIDGTAPLLAARAEAMARLFDAASHRAPGRP